MTLTLVDDVERGYYMEVPERAWTPQTALAVDVAVDVAEQALGLEEGSLTVKLRIPYASRVARLYSGYTVDGAPPPAHPAAKAAGLFSPARPDELWVSATGGPAETALGVLHEAFHAARHGSGLVVDDAEEESAAEAFAQDMARIVYLVAGEEGGLG